ncbi:MAG: hypothetical protein N2203_04755 [Bacteroidia bacterium]|nr:hypothetical protein [Bacteroidia bacterium]
MKKLSYFLVSCTLLATSACKKKNNNANNNNTTPPPVTTCFKDEQSGTYLGDGIENSVPFNGANITITKLSCTSIKIQSPTTTYTISSLSASGSNGYTGNSNTSESSSISFTVSGSQYSVNISIGNTFLFNGNK